MAELQIEQTTFDKINFPPIVYKYRKAEVEWHRTILSDKVVYFAPPNSFEDEKDCKIPVRYDLLTDSEIYKKYLEYFKKMYPNADPFFLRNQATIWTNKGLLRDKQRNELKDEFFWNEFNKVFGVLCLTSKPSNLEMWQKYSDNFNGFCVGFNPKILFQGVGAGGKISYVDQLPVVEPFEDYITKRIKTTFYKLKKWAFEDEYRIYNMWLSPVDDSLRKKIVPSSAFLEIIIGEKVKKNIREELIKEVKKINPTITIRTAYHRKEGVELVDFS